MRFSRSTDLVMFLSLEILASIIRICLPSLVELIDLVNFVIIFFVLLSQITLPRWLTFLHRFQTALIGLLSRIYLFLLALVFVLQWLFFHSEILIMLLPQFPLIFHQIHNRMPPFHGIAYHHSHADWDGLCHHLRDVPWEDTFKLVASVAASEFCE